MKNFIGIKNSEYGLAVEDEGKGKALTLTQVRYTCNDTKCDCSYRKKQSMSDEDDNCPAGNSNVICNEMRSEILEYICVPKE